MLARSRREKMPDYVAPKIQNVVGTINLGCPLVLEYITWKGKATYYNPNRFAAVIMRLRNPKTTGLIFKSGKMVITGAKSYDYCQLASRKYAKIIEKMGFAVKPVDFKVQNVVASTDVKFPISLYYLVKKHTYRKSYIAKVTLYPQVFPGLVYQLQKPKMTFLIFVSGKIVITGARSFKYINYCFESVYHMVREFSKSGH